MNPIERFFSLSDWLSSPHRHASAIGLADHRVVEVVLAASVFHGAQSFGVLNNDVNQNMKKRATSGETQELPGKQLETAFNKISGFPDQIKAFFRTHRLQRCFYRSFGDLVWGLITTPLFLFFGRN